MQIGSFTSCCWLANPKLAKPFAHGYSAWFVSMASQRTSWFGAKMLCSGKVREFAKSAPTPCDLSSSSHPLWDGSPSLFAVGRLIRSVSRPAQLG